MIATNAVKKIISEKISKKIYYTKKMKKIFLHKKKKGSIIITEENKLGGNKHGN